MESALSAAGCRVHGLPDGAELEQQLAAFRPDLVVLDVMLPGRDGFALLDVIRRHSAVGVVLLTARDAVDDSADSSREAEQYVVIEVSADSHGATRCTT